MSSRKVVLAAIAVFMLATPALASSGEDQSAPTTAATAPARQQAKVWFTRPTQIGGVILLGQYVIEHDNDRMGRGDPCTHIYAADNLRKPVVTFHCTHLERPSPPTPTVTIISTGDVNGLVKLQAFQFAGETAAHGVPAAR